MHAVFLIISVSLLYIPISSFNFKQYHYLRIRTSPFSTVKRNALLTSFKGLTTFTRNLTATHLLYADTCNLPCKFEGDTCKISLGSNADCPNLGEVKFHQLSDAKWIPVTPDQENRAFVGIGFRLSRRMDVFRRHQRTIATLGGRILRAFGNYSYGASMIPDEEYNKRIPTKYGVLEDADGNCIEVAHYQSLASPRAKISIQVLDLDESIAFYKNCLNMSLLRKRFDVNSIPPVPRGVAYLGYGSEYDDLILELVYNYSVLTIDHSLPIELHFASSDLSQITTKLKAMNVTVADTGHQRMAFADPNGHKIIVTHAD